MTKSDDRTSYGGWPGLGAPAEGFFRVARVAGRWWLVDPAGAVFLSIGLNHISSHGLRRPERVDDFTARYGTEERWIRDAVVPDLRAWGFNTVGWTQDVVLRHEPSDPLKRCDPVDPRRDWGTRTALFHDPPWEPERYRLTGMPYVHVLNLANIAYYWDGTPWASDMAPHYPDVFGEMFADFCDWVARRWCATMRDDPNLVGYFFADVPDWVGEVHGGHWLAHLPPDHPERPERLGAIARQYYKVAADAVRRYDPNHLLFGDRFLGQRAVPEEVLAAMGSNVDVLSVQYGGDFSLEAERLDAWHTLTGKPVLMADAVMPPAYFEPPNQTARAEAYRRYLGAALARPYIVGVHFCGAYIEAEPRGWGVNSPDGAPYEAITETFRAIHPRIYDMARTAVTLPDARTTNPDR